MKIDQLITYLQRARAEIGGNAEVAFWNNPGDDIRIAPFQNDKPIENVIDRSEPSIRIEVFNA